MGKKRAAFAKTLLILTSGLCLAGCLPDLDPFSAHTDYRITGAQGDPRLAPYLNVVLKDRLESDIDEEAGSEDFARAETYREQIIAGDLLRAMRARGYYAAKIDYRDREDVPLSGTYAVDPGPLYRIAAIEIEPEEFRDMFDFSLLNAGMPLDAPAVLEAQGAFYKAIRKDRCYFSLDVQHTLVLGDSTHTGALHFTVRTGPDARFGPAVFKGMESVENAYLQKLVPWKEGDCFRPEKIETLKTALLESGLFSRAQSRLPEAPGPDGRVAVTLEVKERAQRSVKTGMSYYTDEGAGIILGWEHRNFLGQAEKLSADLKLNRITQSLNATFTKPFFLRKDQSLTLNTAVHQENTDAYDETGIDLGAAVSRRFHRRLTAASGAALSVTEIEDALDRKTFGLFSFPNSVVFDNRDNALDPHKGWQLTASIEPFFDALGESDPFTKLEGGARTYVNFIANPDLVLALRANAGALIGSDTAEIPASERFYAGGGGSVRGFGYQEVGPFIDGDPAGGRSFVTGSAEFRMKFMDNLGGVAFVDAGSVSASASPDFDNLSVGAGLGLRYYTSFGPLRFDVAAPLNEKKNLEKNYQIYISIGQAF